MFFSTAQFVQLLTKFFHSLSLLLLHPFSHWSLLIFIIILIISPSGERKPWWRHCAGGRQRREQFLQTLLTQPNTVLDGLPATSTRSTNKYCKTCNTSKVSNTSWGQGLLALTGPEISASRWLSCARDILHCWRPICTESDVETPPFVHIAMVLMRRQNICCYTAQHTTGCGGSHGQIFTIKVTQDAYGASWRGSGQWPVPPTGNETERKREVT